MEGSRDRDKLNSHMWQKETRQCYMSEHVGQIWSLTLLKNNVIMHLFESLKGSFAGFIWGWAHTKIISGFRMRPYFQTQLKL